MAKIEVCFTKLWHHMNHGTCTHVCLGIAEMVKLGKMVVPGYIEVCFTKLLAPYESWYMQVHVCLGIAETVKLDKMVVPRYLDDSCKKLAGNL